MPYSKMSDDDRSKIQKLFDLVPVGPLNNYLVIEIGGHVSGPFAAEDLARQGALVIKLESMESGGDPSRKNLSREIFSNLNACKASIALDKVNMTFGNASGGQLYAKLLAHANIIIDNRSLAAKKRDTGLEFFLQNKVVHPLIYCSIIGYDAETLQHALDISVQAATGMAMTNAPASQQPLKVGFPVLDITTGIKAASAIKDAIIALKEGYKIPPEHRNIIRIEVSMARVSATLQGGQYLKVATEGKETFRVGNRDLFTSPNSVYPTKDGSILLGTVTDQQFAKLCTHVLEPPRPEWINRYPTNKERLEHVEELEKELTAIFKTQPSQFWLDRCKKQNIICSLINSITQALSQPYAKTFFSQTTDRTLIVADAAASSLFKQAPLSRAPKFNEHADQILALLRLTLPQNHRQIMDVHPPKTSASDETQVSKDEAKQSFGTFSLRARL